jgi:hypothetical protein
MRFIPNEIHPKYFWKSVVHFLLKFSWTPNTNQRASAPFEGLQPPFAPRDIQKIKVSKKAGRGTVTITQRPSAENDQTLGIRIDDNEQPGADRYTVRVTW